MRDKLKLHDARPLDVLIAALVGAARLLPSSTLGRLIRVMTKSRNSCDLRSKARTCQRRPLSISANGTISRSVWPLEMEWYSIAERAFLVDRPGHARQHIQIRMREP